MIGLNTAAIYVLQTLGSLYLMLILLRFVLNWCERTSTTR